MAFFGLFVGWLTTAIAVETLPPDLLALPWPSIGLGALLAVWGGMASTIGRVNRLPKGTVVIREELLKDALVSAVAGTMAFFLGAWWALSVWQIALSMVAAGYMGTSGIDALINVASRRWKAPPP